VWDSSSLPRKNPYLFASVKVGITALRAEERINLIDFSYHLGLAFGGHIVWLIFDDGGG